MLPRMSAALALSLLALSGCSGGDTPPSTLPTLSPAPSPTPTLDAVPSAATAETPDGADAFVRYFFAQMNIAFSRSDASLIEALSTPDCITCSNYAKSLSAARMAGHFLSGPSFRVTAVAASAPKASSSAVDVVGAIPARDSVDALGKLLKHLPEQPRFYFVVTIIRRSGSWVVSDIARGSK